mmetsp:Transcript_94/g.253  ORF Transcript_94/g.253 Transcript_94/m.253 type:complete len:209 (+) Transcript_94:597-1223(+)
MTSSPLFMSVAESVVIFGPMDQLGCLRASATVTFLSWSTSQSLKAPPEAVRMIRRMPSSGSPWMHWKIAECSESAGRILTPFFSASGKTYGPPAISVSLLARQMSFLASMAATVGFSPAHPTIPVTHASVSWYLATSTMPSSPAMISGSGPSMPASCSLSLATSSAFLTETSAGLNLRTCSARRSILDPAASAVTANLSGCSSTISKV